MDVTQGHYFITRPKRPRFAWDSILEQLEDGYKRAANSFVRERDHYDFLEYLEEERWAYQDDLLHTFGLGNQEQLEKWNSSPEGELEKAHHWARYRAEVRAKWAYLGEVEEKMDAIFIAAVEAADIEPGGE